MANGFGSAQVLDLRRWGAVMLFGLVVMAAATTAAAKAPAVVEGLQLPAWLDRGGVVRPLNVGTELQANDTVRTGENARLLLRFAEGSVVKLGENAQLSFAGFPKSDDGKSVFRAALDVLTGAFRFTTDKLAPTRTRDVNIKIASITAGIRGTDLWGRSLVDNKDIVCLIEGNIDVNHGGKDFKMDEPLSFFIAPKDKTPDPVSKVPLDKLAQWAKETEIAEGQGAIRVGGQWAVQLAQGSDQAAALAVYQDARIRGYPAEIKDVRAGKGRTYTVRVRHLPSEAEAQALAAKLSGILKVEARVLKS